MQRRADKKHLHFVAPVVKDIGVPVIVIALTRVGILVQRPTIKVDEAVRVNGEMSWHPVKQHANAFAVQVVNQILEVIGRAKARARCVVACDLIAPGAVKGVLHNAQQFNVGIAHPGDIFSKAVGDVFVVHVPVVKAACPGTQMHLIDADGALWRLVTTLHPGLVMPHKVALPHHAGGVGAHFGKLHVGVSLLYSLTARARDIELIHLAHLCSGHKSRPKAQIQPRKGVVKPVPAIKIAYHADMMGIGRPYRKAHACNALLGHRMCAKKLVRAYQVGSGEFLQVLVTQR